MAVVIPKKYQATVLAKKQLSPKIIWLQAETPEVTPYLAGQYASWLIGNYRRPISFASAPSSTTLEFVVDIAPQGVASRFTAAAEIGQKFDFLAPYGRFVLDEADTRPLLFIATGSGIAPIRAQLQYLFSQRPVRSITLVFGNRNEEHAFFLDEFMNLAAQHPAFTFIPVLSEPSSRWQGERGLVTTIAPQRLNDIPTWSAYVCGSPAMVKDTAHMLQEQGMPAAQIHTEQFTIPSL